MRECRNAVPHRVKELYGQVTEPADAQHCHPRAVEQACPKDPRVYRQAGREQGGRFSRVELRWEPEREPTIDDDMFGQPAVAVDGDDLLPGAELLCALLAEGTTETSLLLVSDTHTIAPLQVGDLGTKLFDDSNDLMARDQGKPRVAPFIIHELDVAPRDATMRDPHQDVMAADRPLIREGLRTSAFLLDRMGSDLHHHSASIPGMEEQFLGQRRRAVTIQALESNHTPSPLACAASVWISCSRARSVEARSSRCSTSFTHEKQV